MGKALKWLRALLNLKRHDSKNQPKNDKRRWSFAKSLRQNSSKSSRPRPHIYDAFTSSAPVDYVPTRIKYGSYEGDRLVWAAVVLQSCFRAFLARRALRALKGLVTLQAVVRGEIMRRRTAETLRRMQAMLRAQARARSLRGYIPESPHSSSKSSQLHQPGPPTPEKFEQFIRANGTKHNIQPPRTKRNSLRSSSSRTSTMNQHEVNLGSSRSERRMKTGGNRADKMLEIDIGMPRLNPNHFASSRSRFLTSASEHLSNSYTTTSKDSNPIRFSQDTESSTQYNSATSQGDSSRRGPLTSTKSDGSRSFLSGNSDCPSYMAYTVSAKAKVRSVSTPKPRPQTDGSASATKRSYSVHGFGEHNPRSNTKKASEMQVRFSSKAYPGSGRLVNYYSGYLN